jgi:hypothetical protein
MNFLNFFKITEELAVINSMQDTCTDDTTILKVKETIFALSLDFKILKCVTSDGGRNISVTHKGLIGNVC